MAEQLVMRANSAELATVSLRPHLIWGPGDNHLVPRLIQRAQTGQLRQVGAGKNLVDATYIDNAADAHLLAADRLRRVRLRRDGPISFPPTSPCRCGN